MILNADTNQAAGIRKGISARLNEAYDAAKQSKERFEVQELSVVDPVEMIRPSPHTAVDRATI